MKKLIFICIITCVVFACEKAEITKPSQSNVPHALKADTCMYVQQTITGTYTYVYYKSGRVDQTNLPNALYVTRNVSGILYKGYIARKSLTLSNGPRVLTDNQYVRVEAYDFTAKYAGDICP